MKKLALVTLITLTSGLAEAATWTDGNQIVEHTIWRPEYHGFYVSPGTFQNPEGCTQAASNLYLFDPVFEESDPRTVDKLYAMILTAQTKGKKLHVFVDGCFKGYPTITGLQLDE